MNEVKIRKGEARDIPSLAQVMLGIFQDMELPLLKKIKESELTSLLQEAMKDESFRYSYSQALVAAINEEILGAVYCYDPSHSTEKDRTFRSLLKEKFSLEEKLFFEHEVFEDEWYLDSLLVFQKNRGKGIGGMLLNAALDNAKRHGASKVGLNVEQTNEKAKKLYEKLGFQKVGEITLATHPYNHLQFIFD